MSASAYRQTKAELASPTLSGREVFHAALLLIGSLLVSYWPAWLGGRAMLPTDVVFDIDPLWRVDRAVSDVETVGKTQSLSAFHMWGNKVFVNSSLRWIWNQNVNDVAFLCCL